MGVKTPPKEYVKLTQEVLSSKTNIFETFPICIENIIKDKIWADVEDKQGNTFKSFEAFCIHPLWQGLELTIDELLSYLKKAPEVKVLVLGELEEVKEHGGNNNPDGNNQHVKIGQVDNSSQPKQTNTGTSYYVKRIKRDFPEHYKRIEAGEKITVLAEELGMKAKQINISERDPIATANRMKKKFSPEFIKQLKEAL